MLSWLSLTPTSIQRNCEACNNFLRIVKSAASCLENKDTSILNMNNRTISNVSRQDSYLVSYNKTSNCSLNNGSNYIDILPTRFKSSVNVLGD